MTSNGEESRCKEGGEEVEEGGAAK